MLNTCWITHTQCRSREKSVLIKEEIALQVLDVISIMVLFLIALGIFNVPSWCGWASWLSCSIWVTDQNQIHFVHSLFFAQTLLDLSQHFSCFFLVFFLFIVNWKKGLLLSQLVSAEEAKCVLGLTFYLIDLLTSNREFLFFPTHLSLSLSLSLSSLFTHPALP